MKLSRSPRELAKDERASCQATVSEAASAECANEHSDGQEPADKGGNSRANHSDGNCKDGTTPQLGLLKTLEGAGLQANPQGGWSRLDRNGPVKCADDHSDSQEAADEHKGEPATEGCI